MLTVLLAWLLTRSIVTPLRKALAVAEIIASGDLTKPIEDDGKTQDVQNTAVMIEGLADSVCSGC